MQIHVTVFIMSREVYSCVQYSHECSLTTSFSTVTYEPEYVSKSTRIHLRAPNFSKIIIDQFWDSDHQGRTQSDGHQPQVSVPLRASYTTVLISRPVASYRKGGTTPPRGVWMCCRPADAATPQAPHPPPWVSFNDHVPRDMLATHYHVHPSHIQRYYDLD